MNAKQRLLVVDDEESLRDIVSQVLLDEDFEVMTATNGLEALELLEKYTCNLVISDVRMPVMDGLTLLQKIHERWPAIEVIIMTSHASLDTAVRAMRAGAYDYLVKPFDDLDVIPATIRRALEHQRLAQENSRLVEQLSRQNAHLEQANRALSELASRDGLTGLHNHRYFQEALTREIALADRHKRNFVLVFIDVDHFKLYNDSHGHLAGDQLLTRLGRILDARLRTGDIAARYGGEEFVILLSATDKIGGYQMAEDLRQRVADHPFEGGDTQPGGRVSISVGLAAYPESGLESAQLIQAADEALYQAKRSGRNRVCCQEEVGV